MVLAMRSKVFAFLFVLCFCINIAAADPWAYRIYRRDGPTTPTNTDASPSPTDSPAPTGTNGNNGGTSTTRSPSATNTNNSNSTSATASRATSTANSTSVAPTIMSTPASLLNYTGYNYTLTPNALPIVPTVTPGYAVAGILLLLTGAAYTLIGIKNKMLHIGLSAAYLSSISVTVLVLYVMNPPVSNAIQGAYVVAAAMTGLILGGASIVFTEMTEGLGCLFGGFCVSMWLLVLKPGGLLTTTSSKSIFIAAFTLVGFATSFSHYTRPFALIGFISFGGATSVIIGIDCFSRAGLKEFWAYLWDLNPNLFPLGATSYPLTRGIKVEIAAIIVIFLAGIVSQMKLWKVIKERREQRAAERLVDEQTMEQEEENVGRRIEHANTAARDQWEATYGDKDAAKTQVTRGRDSGVGDMDSQRKVATSPVTSLRRSDEAEIEMSQMPPNSSQGAGLVMAKGLDGSQITVRVARDLEPSQELDENGSPIENKRLSRISKRSSGPEEKIWVVGADGEARLERRTSQRNTLRNSRSPSTPMVSPAPDVVPLPFRVPEGANEDDDRSSMAASLADDEEGQKRHSRHLSTGSRMMRKLSKRSSRRSSRHLRMGPSTEDLMRVNESKEVEEDRASSLNATMDGLSDDEDVRSIRSSLPHSPNTEAPPHILNPQAESTPIVATPRSLTSSTDPEKASKSMPTEKPSEDFQKGKPAPSVVSAVESKTRSITKDSLPPQLSRVVMSYRTNEWAKHLSNAEAPEPDELKLAEHPAYVQPEKSPRSPSSSQEKATPVNVEELQQTPENALPPPAPRSISQMSNHPSATNVTRSDSSMSNRNMPSRSETATLFSNNTPERSLSQTTLNNSTSISQQPSVRGAMRSVSTPQPILESSTEESFSPALPTNSKLTRLPPSSHQNTFGSATLIGKRNSMIQNKTLYGTPTSSTPDFHKHGSQLQSIPASRAGSEAGSIYNYANSSAGNIAPEDEDDNMSLSARRNLIRQSSLASASSPYLPASNSPIIFDSHQPKRVSSVPPQAVREQQLASWRVSVQQGLQSAGVPQNTIERQRGALWEGRRQEEQRKALEERMRGERDSKFDERMRRGDMLDAHREALRKMQAAANKSAQ